jgi:hypothetical protein
LQFYLHHILVIHKIKTTVNMKVCGFCYEIHFHYRLIHLYIYKMNWIFFWGVLINGWLTSLFQSYNKKFKCPTIGFTCKPIWLQIIWIYGWICVLRKQNKKTWFLIKLFSKNQTLFRGRRSYNQWVIDFSLPVIQ